MKLIFRDHLLFFLDDHKSHLSSHLSNFNADSVYYSEFIVRTIPIHETTSNIDEIKSHLIFIENNIDKFDVEHVM